MGLADFINSRPGSTAGNGVTSKQTGRRQRTKCTCGAKFDSVQQLVNHQSTCAKINEKKTLLKRKATGTGYEDGASVKITTSQTRFRTHIRLWNRMKNDRAVKRSDTRHTTLAIPPLASHRTAAIREQEEQLAKSAEDDQSTDDIEFETSSSCLFDETHAEAAGIDIEAESVSSGDCEPCTDEEDEDEESDEEDNWEDIEDSTVDNLKERLHKIKVQHNRRWAKFRMGDGFDKKGTKRPFKYNGGLDDYYVAQISLLKILSQHRENDLKLFDRIMNWVCFFAEQHPGIWDKRKKYKCHTRKTILPFLAKYFGTKELYPEKKVAIMTDGSKVDIPVFDFKAVFETMMLDRELVCEKNLIQNNFDPNTWRPIKKYDELGPEDIIDDLTTGYLYEKGIELYCDEEPPPGISKILPGPLLFFTDEATYDKKNGCKTGPVSMCLAALNADQRHKNESWFNTAFIPNYGLGLGKYFGNYDDEWEVKGRKKGQKTLTQKKKSQMRVKDHQILYDTVLDSFRRYCDEYGGLRMMWKGELCLVKPYVLMIIGDTKEYNVICNSYNSCRVRCPCKDCLCTWEAFAKIFPPKCERVTLAHRQKAMEDEDYARFISHHQEESAWNNLPIADIIEGCNGMCPLEWLHLNGQGNFKDGPEVLHDMIGPKGTQKARKEELDMLFRALAEEIKRNSERDIPLIALRYSIMDLTQVTANERVGNYFILIVSLSTKRGAAIMNNAMERHKLNLDDVVDTMTTLLAYDAWCRSFGVKKWEIDNAGAVVSQLMQNIIKYLPKEVGEGTHGYHKVKFHGLWLMLEYLKKYGSAKNTSGETGERLHQIVVGMNGNGTQRRPPSFTVQCGTRDGERTIINQAYKHVRHLCPPEEKYDDEEDDIGECWHDCCRSLHLVCYRTRRTFEQCRVRDSMG